MNKSYNNDSTYIKDFQAVFKRHPSNSFVAVAKRRQIFKIFDNFIDSKSVKSPYLFLIGESGIGKTALMANYILTKSSSFIYYFIEYCSRDTLYPEAFIKHIYFSLGKIYGLSNSVLNLEIYDLVELLKKRLHEVANICKKQKYTQVIIIDALDESITDASNSGYHINSIIDVLNCLDIPDNFRILISSSRELTEITLQELYYQTIIMAGNEQSNKADIYKYFHDNLLKYNYSEEEIEKLAENSEGNFQYASFVIQTIRKKGKNFIFFLLNRPPGLFKLYELKLVSCQHNVIG
ncbi:MAG: AAA family ATPase [Promethearchaeota archaeon]